MSTICDRAAMIAHLNLHGWELIRRSPAYASSLVSPTDTHRLLHREHQMNINTIHGLHGFFDWAGDEFMGTLWLAADWREVSTEWIAACYELTLKGRGDADFTH